MHGLTDRQREVLRLAEAGLDDRAIAGALHVTLGTVRSHWHGIYGTLHIERDDARRKRALAAWRRLARDMADAR